MVEVIKRVKNGHASKTYKHDEHYPQGQQTSKLTRKYDEHAVDSEHMRKYQTDGHLYGESGFGWKQGEWKECGLSNNRIKIAVLDPYPHEGKGNENLEANSVMGGPAIPLLSYENNTIHDMVHTYEPGERN